jgi:hypothetical protein
MLTKLLAYYRGSVEQLLLPCSPGQRLRQMILEKLGPQGRFPAPFFTEPTALPD